MKLICEDCGELDSVLVDGYDFSERMLEGVYFKINYTDGKPSDMYAFPDNEPILNWEDDRYLAQLNQKYWMKELAKHLTYADVFMCPKCKEDVYIEEN